MSTFSGNVELSYRATSDLLSAYFAVGHFMILFDSTFYPKREVAVPSSLFPFASVSPSVGITSTSMRTLLRLGLGIIPGALALVTSLYAVGNFTQFLIASGWTSPSE